MRIRCTPPDGPRSAPSTPALETRVETLGDVRQDAGDERSSSEGVRLTTSDEKDP